MNPRVILEGIPRLIRHEPVGLQVDITSRCNLDCAHCYFLRQNQAGELSDDQWIRVLKSYRERGYVGVAYCGGEPFLRLGLLYRLRGLFPVAWVATNGTQPIPNIFSMAYVSLDGCRRAHDEQRRKPGLYSQVIANIQTSSSDRIVVGCCVTTITRTSIGELVADVSRLDVLGIIFNLYTPTKISDRLMLSSSERQDTIDELLRLKREYGDFVRCTPPILERMRKRPPVGTCKLNQVITPLDAQGKRKQGCTMQGICSECGAFPLYLSESFKITEWRAMLRTVNFLRMVT